MHIDDLLESWFDKLRIYKAKQQAAQKTGPLDFFIYNEESLDKIFNHPDIDELKQLEAEILNLEYEICKQIPDGKHVQVESGLIVEKRPRTTKNIPRHSMLSTKYLEQITLRWC